MNTVSIAVCIFYLIWWVFDTLILIGSPNVRFSAREFLLALVLTVVVLWTKNILLYHATVSFMLSYVFGRCMAG